MTNQQINDELAREIKNERKITNRILKLIILAEDRKLHLQRGYSSLHRWLVQEHKYSAAAANRRIQAARLLRAVPIVESKIESGAVNLTTLAQAQSMIRTQEVKTKNKVSEDVKSKVIARIENLNVLQVEQSLMSLLPENISQVRNDHVTAIDESTQRLSVNLSNEAMADLKRAKEILSHAIHSGEAGLVLARVLKEFVARHDPLHKKSHSATVSHRANRVKVIRRDLGRCTFTDPATGHICGETFQVERDHIIPRARGGNDSFENSRTLCRAHNQFMSEQILGKNFANRWRSARTGP